MSARDELAELIRDSHLNPKAGESAWDSQRTADRLITAGYRKPRTISTIEEVDALPHKAIVTTCFGDAVTIYRNNPGIPFEHYRFLISDGTTATVLYEPEQEKE